MRSTMFNISINPAAIEKWKEELQQIEEKIKKLEQRRNVLSTRLHSVPFFMDDNGQEPLPGIQATADVKRQETQDSSSALDRASIRGMSAPDAMRVLLKEAKTPITKRELRERLRLAGFPMEKLGTMGGYLHTIISRWEKSGKLNREGDRIWLK